MPETDDRPRRTVALAALASCTALLLALHLYRPPRGGLWLETLYNSLHVPTFMVILIGLFTAIRGLTPFSVARCVWLATLIAAILGALSEAAQIPGPRDASFDDVISDWLGAVGAALLIYSFAASKTATVRNRLLLALSGIVAVVVAMWPLIYVSMAFVERDRNVPVLFDFNSRFGDAFMRLQNSTLQIRPQMDSGQSVGHLTLGRGAWPGIIFNDLSPDWSAYQFLLIEIHRDELVSLEINFRVHDRRHSYGDQPYSDRFNLKHILKNGLNEIRIPIDQIRHAPETREMNVTDIHGLAIFSRRDQEGRSFGIVTIRLEK